MNEYTIEFLDGSRPYLVKCDAIEIQNSAVCFYNKTYQDTNHFIGKTPVSPQTLIVIVNLETVKSIIKEEESGNE